MARVLGVGGVFFRTRDPQALGDWYQQHLGVPVEHPYGASFVPAAMPPGAITAWAPFEQDTGYFGSHDQPFMVNLVVDDLEGALAQVRAGGATVIDKIEEMAYGRFGWFVDPAGNRVELWEPQQSSE